MTRFTLYGLYQYDPSLFSSVILPGDMEKEALIECIMAKSGDLYTYYQAPDRVKSNIASWFYRQFADFEQIYNSLTIRYDPLEEYDRTEEVTREYVDSGSDRRVASASSQGNTSTVSGGTQVSDKSAYDNASGYSPDSKNTTTGSDSANMFNSASDNAETQYGKRRTESETNHTYGSLGVTPNAKALEDEMKLRTAYNAYNIIAEMFEREHLCQVY